MKKRRLSAEHNWIKRLQTPFPLGLNDQIYQQMNISSVRSNINVFSLNQDVRRKRRSHGLRRNGLSRRKQRLNRSLDALLRIANNNGRHKLLHALSSIPVSRLKRILDDADRRSLRHSDWFKLKMSMAFSFNKLFPRIPRLPPKTQFIKIKLINQGLDLLNISNIFRDQRVASKIPCRQSSKQRHHYLKKILRGSFEGWIEFYEYICTCSADERQTSFASYRYSH